jgi:hypothetical protein
MRSHVLAALGAGAAVLAIAGCAADDQGDQGAPVTSSGPTTTSDLPPLPAEPTPPEAVGVSPGGVTTKVDVPADATESQYGQACRAAKLWLEGQQGDPKTLVEAYLKVLQAPGAVGPGTFDTTWAQLTPAQQAGVVMAVNGAANDECG